MARVLLLGKHPPLIGGVTTSTLSAIASLQRFGHCVDVVTSGPESDFSTTSWPSWERAYPYPLQSSSLNVHVTEALPRGSYIPGCDPLLTKLFGLAMGVADKVHPDVIVGWYLEPFGVAASLLGQVLRRPVILRHAGSDIGRLANHPQLRRAYSLAVDRASAIITTRRSQAVLVERLAASPAKCIVNGGEPLPPWFFDDAPAEFPRIDPSDWMRALGLDERVMSVLASSKARDEPPCSPRLLAYGKVGATKGSAELLEALNRIASARQDFTFVTVPSGHRRAVATYLGALAQLPSLAAVTTVLPPAPNWVIAKLLRHADVACCLENRFPIAFHAPTVPREILASRAQLMVSEEVRAKQSQADSLVDGVNVHVIGDPHDISALTAVAERALFSSARLHLAERGWLLSRSLEQQAASKGSVLLHTVNEVLEAQ